MSTRVRDEDFPHPSELNTSRCVASDRYLKKVDELVTIIRCCQDPSNISLVIVDYSLVGAFRFVPKCYILSVDGDESFETRGITAPFFPNHVKSDEVPILTDCEVHHGQLVFDFGSVIPNYVNANSITFKLEMIGEVPQAFGVSFPSQKPFDIYQWEKGILPNPLGIRYQNNTLSVLFSYGGNVNCSCNINCVLPSGVNYDVEFCPDEEQEIVIRQGSLNGDPENILLRLRDGLGNESKFDGQTIIGARVQAPAVTHYTTNFRNEIRISRRSESLIELKDVNYRVLKFEGTYTNYSILKDWSDRSWDYFTDYDISPNKTYGYAVIYRDVFGMESNLSTWTIVNT